MPKNAATPVKASRKVAVEVDDEDEEEVIIATPAKKATATTPKSSKNGAANGKPTVVKRSTTSDDEGTYTPNPNSMRDFVLRSMKRGGTSAAIKARAAKFAEKKGVDALADVKAYKNFDVAYYAKFLKTKGYDVDIDEEGDSYTLNA